MMLRTAFVVRGPGRGDGINVRAVMPEIGANLESQERMLLRQIARR